MADSEHQRLERLVDDARAVVAAGFPVYKSPGNEVDEYIVPAPQYLALLLSVEAVLGGAAVTEDDGDAG
jgi:hypothetical protein